MIDFNALSDEDLYGMCINGDEGAWQYIYNCILAICKWKKWDLRDEPEELAQDVTMHLIEKAIKKVGDKNKFRGFIEIMTINKIKDSFKKTSGSPKFSEDEFCEGPTVETLCKAINEDQYKIILKSPDNTIERLNELLRTTDFYYIWVKKAKRVALTKYTKLTLSNLSSKTEGYRFKNFSKLSQEQQKSILKLNRLILELTYPQVCPRSKNQKVKVKILSIHKPIMNTKGEEFIPDYEDTNPLQDAVLMNLEIVSIIDTAIKKLSKDCQKVINEYLKFKLGLYEDYKELSKVLKMPIPTISSSVRRCLNKLIEFKEIKTLKNT